MESKMFELAEKLSALREQKKDTEQALKDINAQIEEVDFALGNLMAESETQNFTRCGVMFYLTTKTRASAAAGVKEELFTALKNQGFGSLVTETVNANTLSAFVREQIVANEDVLPGWLTGLVNVFEQTSVGVRSAK